VLGLLGIVVTLARNPALGLGALIGDGLVLLPMLLARDYFWPSSAPSSASQPNYCYRCGHSLQGVTQTHCPNCAAEIRTAGRDAGGV